MIDYKGLARVLVDLDRCPHGRHAADPCWCCPDGQSTGNPHLPAPGETVGYDLAGNPYVMPPRGASVLDADAWRPAAAGEGEPT